MSVDEGSPHGAPRSGCRIDGDVVLPGDETWDAARQAWNLAVDQRPVAVVYPESADDVAATVGLAAEHGLRIAFNAGGHNAGPIDWTEPTAAPQDRADDGDPDRRRGAPRAGRGRRPVAAPRRRGRGARPRVPRRDVTERRRARLRARGRPQLADPDARARVQQHRGGRGRHRGRPPGPRRPRHRARAVLGDPRRWRQRRRGDRDRARAVSRSPRSMPVACSGRSSARPRSSTRGGRGSRPCPRRANPSGGCCSCPTSRSSPSTCAAARSSWSRLAFTGERGRRRRRSSGRCGTSIRSSTRSGPCRPRTSAS